VSKTSVLKSHPQQRIFVNKRLLLINMSPSRPAHLFSIDADAHLRFIPAN
jgi:hypothetical protein